MDSTSEILFISDLHLDRNKPAITKQFLTFLKTRAQHARVLYILGDLFEVWLGDDDQSEAFQPVIKALQNLAKKTQLFFLHGNRDFLIGQQLASHIGFTIISDPSVIKLGQQQVALMHGDLLCTDDIDYQNFRKLVRSKDWQQTFLAKPLNERHSIADDLRDKSSQAMAAKEFEIMDVNQQTVMDTFQQLRVDTLIHGHTHRPAIHHLPEDKQRIVLGDWNPGPSFLSWNEGEFSLVDPGL